MTIQNQLRDVTTTPVYLQIERDEAADRIDKWEQTLGAVMRTDFKDWHDNNPSEWPDIAAFVITNQREHSDSDSETITRLYAVIDADEALMREVDSVLSASYGDSYDEAYEVDVHSQIKQRLVKSA